MRLQVRLSGCSSPVGPVFLPVFYGIWKHFGLYNKSPNLSVALGSPVLEGGPECGPSCCCPVGSHSPDLWPPFSFPDFSFLTEHFCSHGPLSMLLLQSGASTLSPQIMVPCDGFLSPLCLCFRVSERELLFRFCCPYSLVSSRWCRPKLHG